jgi:hypothetical protein
MKSERESLFYHSQIGNIERLSVLLNSFKRLALAANPLRDKLGSLLAISTPKQQPASGNLTSMQMNFRDTSVHPEDIQRFTIIRRYSDSEPQLHLYRFDLALCRGPSDPGEGVRSLRTPWISSVDGTFPLG